MTWFADGAPCDYFGNEHVDTLLAVGWLSLDRPFPVGAVPAAVIERLDQLCRAAWTPGDFLFMGVHECELCLAARDPGSGGLLPSSAIGSRNLLVPDLGRNRIWVAPNCLHHYVVAHAYRPPTDFQQLLLACPDPGSADYGQRLVLCGGPGWRERVDATDAWLRRLRE